MDQDQLEENLKIYALGHMVFLTLRSGSISETAFCLVGVFLVLY